MSGTSSALTLLSGADGLFGAEVAAPSTQRVIAFTGRSPL
jgi:hypothetical protein